MCLSPITIKQNGEEKKVRCGKCILCRRRKCREWALKLYHESQYHKKMCMITLTFRPKFLLRPKWKELKKTKSYKDKNGRRIIKYIKYKTCISPKYITNVNLTGWLLTLFIKKLRKELQKQNKQISYFAVGEHGSQNTHRAHWHVLIFGIDKTDLQCVNIGKSKKGKEIWYSKIIEKLWNYEKMNIGQHTISDVTTATIKYVANYTMKKMYKDEKNSYPTKMRFSSHNKIGIKWARRYHKELRKEYLTDNEGQKYAIPECYYNEMKRYENLLSNESMTETAIIIENNKIDKINKLIDKGLMKDEEIRKKAKRLEMRYKKEDRDTI